MDIQDISVSTLPFPQNKYSCSLTEVNFITEDIMLWYTHLYENIFFINKWDTALFRERKVALGRDRVAVIKSLITRASHHNLTQQEPIQKSIY